MSLTSPLMLLAAWVLVPGMVALLSWGLGHGARLVSGQPLGALTLPVGFVGGAGIGSSLLRLGLSGTATVVAIVLLCLAGPAAEFWRRRRTLRRPGRPSPATWAAAGAALAAYAIGIAPLAGSGRGGLVGYVLSNDPAVHLSLIALLAEGGTSPQVEPSSLQAVSAVLGSGYPLGSYVWPLAAQGLTGVDPFLTWTPLIALASAMTALGAYAALRQLGGAAPVAAAGGALVASGYLPFSYLAQGGAKEVALATAVLTAVAAFGAALRAGVSLRTLVPAALATTGATAIFGPGALAFLGPPAVVAALLALLSGARAARVRAAAGLAGAAALSLLLAAPALTASTRFVNASQQDTRDPNEIGNLVGPVPVREALNVWLAADYRFPTPERHGLTTIALAAAAMLAVAGIIWALRRRAVAIPLLLLGAGVAAAYTQARYSAYFAAKTYVVLAVALGLATAAGVIALLARPRAGLRRAGAVTGVLVAVAVLASDWYVYRGAWLTPKARFQELVDLNERYAGQGPALVVEREDYAKYLLRDLSPWESWGFWQPDRGLLIGLDPFHTPDLDDYRLDFLDRFQLIVERKRPGGSLPPSGFAAAEETAHYRIWRRTGALPEQHVGVRGNEVESSAPLDCASPEVQGLLAAARRQGEPVRAMARESGVLSTEPTDWAWFTARSPGPTEAYVSARDKIAVPRSSLPPGRYRAWIRGQLGPGLRLYVGDAGGKVGEAFGDVGQLDQWLPLGEVTVRGASGTVLVQGLRRPWWLSGSRRADLVGSLAFEPIGAAPQVREVPAARARQALCGRSLDWIELR